MFHKDPNDHLVFEGEGVFAPPGPFFHTHVFVPHSLSLSLSSCFFSLSLFFPSLSLFLLGLWGPLSGIGVARRLPRVLQKCLEECTQAIVFLSGRGRCCVFSLAALFRNSAVFFLQRFCCRAFESQIANPHFPPLLCMSERGNAVRFCRGDGFFCDIVYPEFGVLSFCLL